MEYSVFPANEGWSESDKGRHETPHESSFTGVSSADETMLTVERDTALEHTPQVAEEEYTKYSPGELVSETLAAVDRIANERDAGLAALRARAVESGANSVSLTGSEIAINTANDFIDIAFKGGRGYAWTVMEKAPDGYVHGSENLAQAVMLTPHLTESQAERDVRRAAAESRNPRITKVTPLRVNTLPPPGGLVESQAVRDVRRAAAVYQNAQIVQGVPAVMVSHDGFGGKIYDVGVPAHDGFAIGVRADDPDMSFRVGITEPQLSVGDAWWVDDSRGASPDGDNAFILSSVDIATGDDVGRHIALQCSDDVADIAVYDEVIGTDVTYDPQVYADKVHARSMRTRHADNIIGAVHAAKILGLDLGAAVEGAGEGGVPAEQSQGVSKDALAAIIRSRVFGIADNPYRQPEELTQAVDALQYVYGDEAGVPLSEYLLQNTRGEWLGVDPTALAEVLRRVADISPKEALIQARAAATALYQ